MRDERAWLLDMLLEVRRIQRFVGGLTLEEFAGDEQALYAVTKAIENLGEAARQLIESAPHHRDRSSEIAWNDIIGMRNVLAHQYFRIDAGRVWMAATRDVPGLIDPLEALLARYD
jgi:uncharacterized protein with HEPN domain